MPYQVTQAFSGASLARLSNVWTFDVLAGGIPSDSAILEAAETWMLAIYAPLQSMMWIGIVPIDGRVVEVDSSGSVIRVVGTVTPAVGGGNLDGSLATTTAGSVFARTTLPRVRGSKRLPCPVEGRLDLLTFDNAYVAALGSAIAAWIAGPQPPQTTVYVAGVMSSVAGAFQRFSGTGVGTSIPGTQVTRKIGSGE